MVDIDTARRFLAAEFENAGLPHTAGSILAGISPFGKGAYIAAVAAALSAQPFPGGQQSAWMLPDDARIVGVIAESIERGKLDHPGLYRNTQLGEVLRRVLSAALADRQPVGQEPVGEIALSDDGYKIGLLGPLRAHRLPLGTKLYSAPPAQAVNLVELPEGWGLSKLETCYQLSHGNDIIGNFVGPDAEENAAIIARVIDSQAVGNG
ncbi:TPA: hypothetical protein ACOECF_000239 [Stenotrophomonas maltophilia]|uniref:hypothetical protein n=1 Tax=Stenotrophomonas maltophilia TaxID=40324 RepID=UPI0013DAD5F1|nr:hypothetical protein [Stenotrophomonas maltophilia]MBH1886857.1 hypothetical protein [Stenotrophomonas maltophilia]